MWFEVVSFMFVINFLVCILVFFKLWILVKLGVFVVFVFESCCLIWVFRLWMVFWFCFLELMIFCRLSGIIYCVYVLFLLFFVVCRLKMVVKILLCMDECSWGSLIFIFIWLWKSVGRVYWLVRMYRLMIFDVVKLEIVCWI